MYTGFYTLYVASYVDSSSQSDKFLPFLSYHIIRSESAHLFHFRILSHTLSDETKDLTVKHTGILQVDGTNCIYTGKTLDSLSKTRTSFQYIFSSRTLQWK